MRVFISYSYLTFLRYNVSRTLRETATDESECDTQYFQRNLSELGTVVDFLSLNIYSMNKKILLSSAVIAGMTFLAASTYAATDTVSPSLKSSTNKSFVQGNT